MKQAAEEDFDVVWSGTMGHDGKSLADGEGLGSSLGGGFFDARVELGQVHKIHKR